MLLSDQTPMSENHDLTEKLDAYFASLPVRLASITKMDKPNAIVNIYKGVVNIRHGDKSFECVVEILFKWQPRRGVEFFIEDDRTEVSNIFVHQMIDSSPINLLIDGFEFGDIIPTNVHETDNKYVINGMINPPVIQYVSPKTVEAGKVMFDIFNFVNILGCQVRKPNIKRNSTLSRLYFPSEKFDIIVDGVLDKPAEWKEISEQGGYGRTHVGALASKSDEKIEKKSADNILEVFGLFLSFLAGKKTSPFFLAGKQGNETRWVDYTNYNQDSYKHSKSWLPQMFDDKIGALWNEFYLLSQDNYDRDTLSLVVHWYLSANKNSGGLEGGIILLQNAFELLFRWIVVEQKNMISPDGGDALRASDKIRMLLYLINCGTDLPNRYQEQYKDLIKKDTSLVDFPYLFTEIRNSYVHSNRKKRVKINTLPSDYLNAILTCGLYYVELLILYLLNYDGKIAQRISTGKFRGGNECSVPWANVVGS